MTREAPSPDCVDVGFSRAYELGEGAEVALEDYARVLARARSAEAVEEGGAKPRRLRGVHLCAPEAFPDDAVRGDVEAFARELAAPPSDRLGWS
jgi:hypothetical protein